MIDERTQEAVTVLGQIPGVHGFVVGESVTEAEDARVQQAAYALHVARRRPDLDGPWTGTPEPHLDTYGSELLRVIELTAGGV